METEFLPIDYADQANWLWFGEGKETAQADAFVLPGSVFAEPEGNVALSELSFRREQGLVNRMKGMVNETCTVYAPARRQATMMSFLGDNAQEYLDKEYADAAAAFTYYVENVHESGRPLVLFGYSSGGMCALRLLEEFFAPDTPEAKALREDLAAAYLIGWGVPESVYEEYPNLKPAMKDDDTGVIISFDAELANVTETPVLKADVAYEAINPLNWERGSTPADKSENEGAVLVNAKGEVKQEIPGLCGAFLEDSPRRALKVTDIDPEDFPTTLSIFPDGSLHEYDILLFYRNIEENVEERVEEWLEVHGIAVADD